jgi:putative copper export protein
MLPTVVHEDSKQALNKRLEAIGWGLFLIIIGALWIIPLVYVIAGQVPNRSDPSPQLLLALIGQTFGASALSMFYMTSLVLLAQTVTWERRLHNQANSDRAQATTMVVSTARME